MIPLDLFIIGGSLALGLLFGVLGSSSVYKAYTGMLIGFLICLLINLKIQSLAGISSGENIIDSFIIKNKALLASISVICIPLVSLFFLLNRNISFKSHESSVLTLLSSFFLGLILVPLSLGFVYLMQSFGISAYGILKLLMDFLQNSFFGKFLQNYEYILFLLLFFLFLYKFIFRIFIGLFLYLLNGLHNLREEEKGNRKRDEGSDTEEENSEEEKNTTDHH